MLPDLMFRQTHIHQLSHNGRETINKINLIVHVDLDETY